MGETTDPRSEAQIKAAFKKVAKTCLAIGGTWAFFAAVWWLGGRVKRVYKMVRGDSVLDLAA